MTFVGVEKADYDVTTENQSPSDYQFWFIFLREKLVTDDVIYSRLVRVCRNDPGSMATEGGGAQHFSTFMKARIFCDKPSTLEFADTLDYVYNSISKSHLTPLFHLDIGKFQLTNQIAGLILYFPSGCFHGDTHHKWHLWWGRGKHLCRENSLYCEAVTHVFF